MSNKMSNKSDSNSNKAQKTNDEGDAASGSTAPPTLAKALVKEAGILRNLVKMTSMPQTFLLLTTCKELHTAEEEVFDKHKLPVVCDMYDDEGLKMYHAMVGVPNSRWLVWFDTSGVEELSLPESTTDEEMLILFSGGGKRFSKLQTLHLAHCSNITDASVLKVARRYSNLQSLDLEGCWNITDTSMSEVARRCSNLQSLDLTCCRNITDASLLEVARGCSNLQSLNLYMCQKITDVSLLEVARECSNLQFLNLTFCQNITGRGSFAEMGRLQSLILRGCQNITDASVLELARGCSNLQSLNLGYSRITSVCKGVLRQLHPKLQLIEA